MMKRSGSPAGLSPAAACALALLLCSSPVDALTISYNDFSDVSALQLNSATSTIGNPVTNAGGNKVLRLTDDLGQSGSAFLKNTVSLASDASFSTMFSFRISNPMGISDGDGQGADGIVFVVQTIANNAGGSGGGIGYLGIASSLGIEYDTWDNGSWDDNNGNHVGINLNGDVNSVSQININTRMNNGDLWYSWVDYDGATKGLEVRLSNASARPSSALLSYTVDLVSVLGTPDAFIGFTSGTGAAGGYHDIESWYLNSTYNPISNVPPLTTPVPEPASIVLLGAGLAGFIIAGMRRKKD